MPRFRPLKEPMRSEPFVQKSQLQLLHVNTQSLFVSIHKISNTSTTYHCPGRFPQNAKVIIHATFFPLREFLTCPNIYRRLQLHAHPNYRPSPHLPRWQVCMNPAIQTTHGGAATSSRHSRNLPGEPVAKCGDDRLSPRALTWHIRRPHRRCLRC